jgi:hypothetical protein
MQGRTPAIKRARKEAQRRKIGMAEYQGARAVWLSMRFKEHHLIRFAIAAKLNCSHELAQQYINAMILHDKTDVLMLANQQLESTKE